MAEKNAIARPYARAVFEIALQANEINTWSEFLQFAKIVTEDTNVQRLWNNPRIEFSAAATMLLEIYHTVFNCKPTKTINNFIKLLVEQRRLLFLPEMAVFFAEYRAMHERTVDVELSTVAPMTDILRDKFAKALKIRLGRDINLKCSIDLQLLGGALIRAKDLNLVIDGSLRRKLSRMMETLNI